MMQECGSHTAIPWPMPQVKFLEYIRQWRKKVVFVVNKVDMLGSDEEVEEVKM